VSTKELLQAAEQLSGQELDELVSNLLHLRAQRVAPCLPETEDGLLQQINAALPSNERRRYRQLIEKRRATTLSPQEHEELLRLTEQEERHNLGRVEALAKLAALRKKPVRDLMADLGLKTLHDG
jgi:hypothetical protein